MAPQPIPQQPMNFSGDQILALISMMNNRKGSMNADISTLFDPQFGFMSGSYNQTSPEDLDSLYAPQTNAIRNSGDANLLGILGAMENGKSAFQIQRSINEKIADGSLPADPDGTGRSYLDLVDTLFKEQNTVKEKMFDQNKIFTNAGLSTPDQRFDPQTYMPEPFKAIDEKVAANKPKVNSALAAIKAKYDLMDKNANDAPVDSGDSAYIDYLNGKNPNYMFDVQEKRRTNAAELSATAPGPGAYIDYLNGKNPDYQQEVIDSRAKRAAVKRGQRNNSAGVGSKDSKTNKSREQQIRDSNRQLEIERAGGQAKQIISPNSINQQAAYNPYDQEATGERMKQLIAQAISQGLEQRGEIPTNVELLQRTLLNKNSKG
jgi:hypothetical protein